MAGDIRRQQEIRELLRIARAKPNPSMGGALDVDVHVVTAFDAYVDIRVDEGVGAQMQRLRDEYAANMSAERSRAAELAVLEERARLKQIVALRAKTLARSETEVGAAKILDEMLNDWLS